MNKVNIPKIVESGSTQRKLQLLAEDNARAKFSLDRLLGEEDESKLYTIFKNPKTVAIWNRWRAQDRLVTNAIGNLQGLKFEVLMHYSNLRGYILVWNSIENAELMANSILHEIKDPAERARLARIGADKVDLLFSSTDTDEEGYIEIRIRPDDESVTQSSGRKSKQHYLWGVMNNVRRDAIQATVRFLSWRKAILDYMAESRFNLKTYRDIIEGITEDVYRPIIGWTKYMEEDQHFLPGIHKERLDKIKETYAIIPDIDKLEIDMDIYNHFKEEFLKDE